MSTELLAHSKVLSSLQQECLTLKQRVRQAVLFGEDSEAAPTTTERRSSIPERKGSLGLAHSFSAPRAMEGRKVRQVGFGDDDDDSFGSDPLPPTAERKGSTTGLLSHSFSAKGALDGGRKGSGVAMSFVARDRSGSRSGRSGASWNGALRGLEEKAMLTRVADQVGELVGDWTLKALEGVLEAYHGIAAIARGGAPRAQLREREAARRKAEARWRAQYESLQLESRDQIETLRAQLLLRTAALGTLRDAYYREVIAIKRRMIEAGAASTVGDPRSSSRASLTEGQTQQDAALRLLLDADPALLSEGLGLNSDAAPPPPAGRRRRARRRAPTVGLQPRRRRRRGGGVEAAAGGVSVGAHLGLAVDARLEGGVARRLDRHVARPRRLPPPRHRHLSPSASPMSPIGASRTSTSPPPPPPRPPRRRRRAAARPRRRAACPCRGGEKSAKRLELPWLEHEYSLYHYYTIQAANARLRDFSRIRELEEKLAEAHQVLEVVQKELKTLRPLRRKRGGAEGARDTGVQTTTAALTEGATQTDNTRPSIRNANTQTDVVEAPPPPPPEAEAPAAAPAAEEMPGALSERLRTAQETLASLASTLSAGEIEAWREQMVSTRGTLMDDARRATRSRSACAPTSTTSSPS